MHFTRAQAVTGFTFQLRSSTDGTAITSGTVTGRILKDGGTQGLLSGSAVHEGNGQWSIDLTATEMDADLIGLLFTHTSAIPAHRTIRTGRGFPKNTAVTGYPFVMVSSSDGSAITSGTVNGFRTLDGGTQTALGSSPTHKGNGQWAVDLTAAEMNGDVVGLEFTHTSALNEQFTIKTVAAATTDERLWNILQAAQDGLQNDLTFTAQGGDSIESINNQAIVIRKYAPGQDNEEPFKNERKPGIIISTPSRFEIDPEAGENDRDDVRYPVLFQFIASDSAHSRQENYRTFLRWQEQLARYFRNQQLTDTGGNCLAWTAGISMVDNIDERTWVAHPMFVGGVEVTFVARETRGI